MNSKEEQAAELRRKAEEKFQTLEPSAVSALSKDEVEKLFHELRVHQIELEMQNHELRQAQNELELARSRYFELYDLAPVGYLTLSEKGLILEVNLTAITLLGATRSEMVKRPISQFILKEDQDIYYLHRKKLFETGEPQQCELRMLKADETVLWAQLDATVAQDDDGAPVCRVILSDITERKQAEDMLAKTEAKQAKMVANIGDVIVIIDLDGINRYKSPNIMKWFGWTPDEVVGTGALDLVHPDDVDRAQELIDDLMSEPNRTGTIECRYRCEDGTYKWIEFTGINLLHDSDIQGILGNYHDITERKQREIESLMLKAAVDQMPVGLAMADADCRLYFCNAAGLGLRGDDSKLVDIPKEAYDNWQVLKPNGEPYEIEELPLVKAVSKGMTTREEFIVKHQDGSEHICDAMASPVYGETGIIGGLVVFPDITDRKQAEAEKGRLLMAINQAAETIVITDAAGTIRYVNPAFEKITGYACEEAVGQNPRILKSGEQNDAFYQGMWNTLLRGAIWSGRMVNRRKDGKHYTEEAKISPVKDSAGKTINYVAVKRDVTAELAREEQCRQAQKMETVGQLAGGIVHDFNNILQTISGFCEILEMEMDQCVDGQPADYVAQLADVGEIHRAARHAADLTRQLLTFSRKQSTEQREIDLGAVLADGMQMLRQAVDERVKLEFQPAPAPLTVHADVSQMMQIVMNLVVNARDAMPDGGKVAIAVEAVRIGPDDVAGIARSRPGEFVCLSVSDTGAGMDANRLKHLFEPFFTTKKVGEGTGLGLSVVYGIVENHHGWIDVSSTVGAGTTFRIYLPVYDGAAVNPPDAPPDGEAVVLGRILLVEDDPVVRDLTGEILQDMGYAVFASATAHEARQLFAAENGAFDLLFIDVMLPDGNGSELAEALLEETAGVPVLLCSGSDRQANSEWAAQKGFDYMPKPYGLRTLLDAVGKSLQERRTTKENT